MCVMICLLNAAEVMSKIQNMLFAKIKEYHPNESFDWTISVATLSGYSDDMYIFQTNVINNYMYGAGFYQNILMQH